MTVSAHAIAEKGPVMNPEVGSLLVVDDEEVERDILAFHLRKQGFAVTAAADGSEALRVVRGQRFDLVLLDVVMPGLSGLEVLAALRQTHPATDLPVIMATAKDEGKDVVRALKLGANDYLTKPFDFPVVLARVQTQLSLKRSVDRIRRLEQNLAQRNAELERANWRMKADLELAARVQEALLPQELPNLAGARFAWSFRPCTELAGDLLNVVPLGEHHVGLYVLNVVGHGVAAALLAVTVHRTLARLLLPTTGEGALGGRPPSPAEVAAQLSREFPWDHRTAQFFTLLFGTLDLGTGEFRFISADHPGPVHVPRDGEPRSVDVPGQALALGESRYEEESIRLRPGDRLYLYSDGLTKAVNAEDRPFGAARLRETLHQLRATALPDSVALVRRRVEEWCSPGLPRDDISILAVEVGEPAVGVG
jgi:sigma-B regulation protein RsbU (phosphoserine phosphatase)